MPHLHSGIPKNRILIVPGILPHYHEQQPVGPPQDAGRHRCFSLLQMELLTSQRRSVPQEYGIIDFWIMALLNSLLAFSDIDVFKKWFLMWILSETHMGLRWALLPAEMEWGPRGWHFLWIMNYSGRIFASENCKHIAKAERIELHCGLGFFLSFRERFISLSEARCWFQHRSSMQTFPGPQSTWWANWGWLSHRNLRTSMDMCDSHPWRGHSQPLTIHCLFSFLLSASDFLSSSRSASFALGRY